MKTTKNVWCKKHQEFHIFGEVGEGCWIEFWVGSKAPKPKRFRSSLGYEEPKTLEVGEASVDEKLNEEFAWS
jgi:hypothetical protein